MKPIRSSHRSRRGGFSLVEISLVVGLIAVAFIPLVALMPSGLKKFRGAMNFSICAQIAQRVINDATQADFDTLIDRADLVRNEERAGFTFRAPLLDEPRLRFFDEQGGEIIPESEAGLSEKEKARIIYQVNTRIMPQAPLPASLEMATGPITNPSLALVTVQVAWAPPPVVLEFSKASPADLKAPDRNLFAARPGQEVFTYSAWIGRGL